MLGFGTPSPRADTSTLSSAIVSDAANTALHGLRGLISDPWILRSLTGRAALNGKASDWDAASSNRQPK